MTRLGHALLLLEVTRLFGPAGPERIAQKSVGAAMQQIAEWLKQLGMSEYTGRFFAPPNRTLRSRARASGGGPGSSRSPASAPESTPSRVPIGAAVCADSAYSRPAFRREHSAGRSSHEAPGWLNVLRC